MYTAPHLGPVAGDEDNSDSKERPDPHNFVVVRVVDAAVVQAQDLIQQMLYAHVRKGDTYVERETH